MPKHILAHGWITIDQTKMSKSLGNVISPTGVLESFNQEIPDALRYYMASAAPCGKDGNYSDEDFKEKVNAHLANSMGNLLNRTLSMLVKYFEGDVRAEFKVKSDLFDKALETVKAVKHHFDYYEVQEAAQKINELVDITNKYVTDNAPWTLAKEEKMTECGQVLTTVLEIMCVVSSLIYPYCPNIAKSMAEQLSYDLNTKLDDVTCDNIKVGHLIDKEAIKPGCEMQIKHRVVYLEIAKAEKIKVSAKDYKDELKVIANEIKGTVEEAAAKYSKEALTPYLQIKKVSELVKSTAIVK